MSAEPGLPQVGELVRFTTKANGDVVGSYFNGLFYSVTSNDCWSPQYVTSWCRVLVLPDTAETWRTVATACTPLRIEAALREAAIR